MVKARPDVPRDQLALLAKAYVTKWSVNGGLDERELKATTDALYQGEDFKDLKRVEPNDWIDRSYIDTVLKAQGEDKAATAAGNRCFRTA